MLATSASMRGLSIVCMYAWVIVCGVHVHAQSSTWVEQNPMPTGRTLNDVVLDAQGVGLIVGMSGTILKTVDGGETWTHQKSGTTLDLYDIERVDALTAWAFGADGMILKTTNGGIEWTRQQAPDTRSLHAAVFEDDLVGTVVGSEGAIHRTTDGGVYWYTVSSGVSDDLASLSRKPGGGLVAAGAGGTVLTSTVDGSVWTRLQTGVTDPIYDVGFADAQIGLGVMQGAVIRTTDGGVSWTKITLRASDNFAHVFSRGNGAWTAIQSDAIAQSTDDGQTWTSKGLPFNNYVTGYARKPDESMMLVGYSGGIYLWKTDVDTLHKLTKGLLGTVRDVSFGDANHGLVTGISNELLYTTNGGTAWQSYKLPASIYVRASDMIDANNAIVSGGGTSVFRTSDGGTTWVSSTNSTDAFISKLKYITPQTVLALHTAAPQKFLRSDDAGATWQLLPFEITGTVEGFDCTPDGHCLAVGKSGLILYSSDNGTTWTERNSGNPWNFSSVAFADAQHATAVGDLGRIYRTEDGGTTWTRQETGSSTRLSAVHMASPLLAVAVGERGRVVYTANGGITWSVLDAGISSDLYGVHVTNANVCTIVGDNGCVMRSSAVVVGVDDTSPIASNPSMLRMLPNPASQNSTLSYSLVRGGKVRVDVVNASGLVVAVVLDAWRDAGTHAAPFETLTLPSGSYMVRLHAEGVTLSCPLVVVR